MSNYRYQIEQYHSIGKADIAINGITVLAGVNGAGKSTLARWLYYIVNIAEVYETNLFEKYQQNLAEQIRKFEKVIKDIADVIGDSGDALGKTSRSILDFKYNGNAIESADSLLEIYSIAIKQFVQDFENAFPVIEKNREIRILNYLQIEKKDGETAKFFLDRILNEQLSKGISEKEQFLKLQKERPVERFFGKTSRTYNEKDHPTNISFQEDGVEIISKERIGTLYGLDDAVYIDTPLAISVTHSSNIFWDELHFRIMNQYEVEDERKVRKLLAYIKRITGGEVIEKKDLFGQEELLYTRESDHLTIKLKDTATGIKAFAYIEQLLKKGHLTNHTLLIIDEPEAHLHPQWIVEFAKLLIMLNKEMGVKFMIASHDPDMVSAIRYVADAEGVIGNTNFYLAGKDADAETFTYKQLGKDIDPIFESFNKSFDLIEKYGIDNG